MRMHGTRSGNRHVPIGIIYLLVGTGRCVIDDSAAKWESGSELFPLSVPSGKIGLVHSHWRRTVGTAARAIRNTNWRRVREACGVRFCGLPNVSRRVAASDL
jgi:hypothetical protein